MKIAWVGLVFHTVMLVWLYRDGLPSHKTSKPCLPDSDKQRLLVVILPGDTNNYSRIFREYSKGVVGNVIETPKCSPIFCYFSGVSVEPLFPDSLDTVFDHVDLAVYSGRDLFPFKKNILDVKLPLYARKRASGRHLRAELDGLSGLLVNRTYRLKQEENGNGSIFLNANSSLFVVQMGGLRTLDGMDSLDIVRRLYFDILTLVKSINFLFNDGETSVLILSENGGPFALWGPHVLSTGQNHNIRAMDVAPLISSLLGVPVPHDSEGVMRASIIDCPHLRARALYCNAQQLSALLEQSTISPMMQDLRIKPNATALFKWLDGLLHRQLWPRSEMFAHNVTLSLSWLLQKVKKRFDHIMAGLVGAATVIWGVILIGEQSPIPYRQGGQGWLSYFVIHVCFTALTLIGGLLPLIVQWPSTSYIFTICPIAFAWIAFSRYDALYSVVRSLSWKEIPMYFLYLVVMLLMAEYSLRASRYETPSLLIGVCLLVHFPALPRFAVSPFIAISAWWWCCSLLLGALYLPDWPNRAPKFYNFSGTLLICLAGFATFFMKNLRDSAFQILFTVCIGVSLLLQSISRAPFFLHQLKYITIPLMFLPYLSLAGKKTVKNRLIHVTSSFVVVVALTSTRLEALCFILTVFTTILWSLMENLRLDEKIGADEIRRGLFLAIVCHTTVAITRTMPEAYLHIDTTKWLPFIEFYRHSLILGAILIVYMSLVPARDHVHSSYVIVLISDAIATLRSIIAGVDSTQLHLHGAAFAVAYYIALLFHATSSKGDWDYECRPREEDREEEYVEGEEGEEEEWMDVDVADEEEVRGHPEEHKPEPHKRMPQETHQETIPHEQRDPSVTVHPKKTRQFIE